MKKVISILLFAIMILNVFACAKTNTEKLETKASESTVVDESTTEKKQYEEIKIGDSIARINMDTFVIETVAEENETKENLDNSLENIFRENLTKDQ